MNVGYEEEELKPYIEPQPDYKDPRRTGVQLNIKKDYFPQISVISQVKSKPLLCADIMLTMGYSQEEIKDSLVNQKYNEVMATYLLLDYKNSEVQSHLHTAAFLCAKDGCKRSSVVCFSEGFPL